MILLFRTREKCAINFAIVSDESDRKISHTQKVTTVQNTIKAFLCRLSHDEPRGVLPQYVLFHSLIDVCQSRYSRQQIKGTSEKPTNRWGLRKQIWSVAQEILIRELKTRVVPLRNWLSLLLPMLVFVSTNQANALTAPNSAASLFPFDIERSR
jgi:hypothetical protein